MCLSALKQNMHFLCTNLFEASTFFLSPWTTHGNFTVFHALGVGNLNLAWVGWGGIWTSGMRDFWFYNIFWSHRELFIKNCAWLGHLNAILAHGGQEFRQTHLQKFKCHGVACGRDVAASNWLMHHNLDLKPVLLQSILCCYSSLC